MNITDAATDVAGAVRVIVMLCNVLFSIFTSVTRTARVLSQEDCRV